MISPESEACAELLQEALELAKEGKISSIGLIACLRDGFATVMAGKQASELFLASGALQRKILDAVNDGAVASGGPKMVERATAGNMATSRKT